MGERFMKEDLTIETAKHVHIYKVLGMNLGNQVEIAKALGISVRTLRNYTRKMRKLGWKITNNLTETEARARKVKKETTEYNFPTNKERLRYINTKTRTLEALD